MENKITLPIGMSNFTEIRKNHYYYIDKTGLIENLLQNNLSKGTLITRPRRFGKTLAMCMLADFFDIFYIGEGETVYDALMDAYKANKAAGGSREQFLEMAAAIPGLYVPAFYDVAYNEDGTIASFGPNRSCAPAVIDKQVVTDLSSVRYPEKPLVPFIKVTQDRVVLEIQAVSGVAVSVRQAWYIVRTENVNWII